MDLAAALQRITMAGLPCMGPATPHLHIVGGKTVEHAAGIDVYQDGFGIVEVDGQFWAGLAQTKQHPAPDEANFDQLDAAVAWVLRRYEART
jgi:hypothetical protein